MPAKIARSAPRPPFGLPEVLVAVRTSRLSCGKAGKARIFTPVRESSGESRLIPGNARRPTAPVLPLELRGFGMPRLAALTFLSPRAFFWCLVFDVFWSRLNSSQGRGLAGSARGIRGP